MEDSRSVYGELLELCEYLARDACKTEAKRLLYRTHDVLLRTLERAPSADSADHRRGVKPPAFPAPATKPAGDTVESCAASLLDLDDPTATTLLALFKRSSYNNSQVLAHAPMGAGTACTASQNAALLRAEVELLRHAHEQRCLLLRCVHQLIVVAYDATAELHAVACSELAMLLQVSAARSPSSHGPAL